MNELEQMIWQREGGLLNFNDIRRLTAWQRIKAIFY